MSLMPLALPRAGVGKIRSNIVKRIFGKLLEAVNSQIPTLLDPVHLPGSHLFRSGGVIPKTAFRLKIGGLWKKDEELREQSLTLACI